MTTIFVEPAEWSSDFIEIEGASFHHLFRVSRLARGDRLRVADGEGHARTGIIGSVRKDGAEVRLGVETEANESPVGVELLVAAPKKPRAEWLVEKTTELGVVAIRFLQTERGPRSFGTGTMERFRRISLSAARQCERSALPEITGMHEREEIPDLVAGAPQRLVLDSSGADLVSIPRSGRLAILVGPEGGWSSTELDRFAESGFTVASLGSRALRIETAGMVAVGVCTRALTPLERGR